MSKHHDTAELKDWAYTLDATTTAECPTIYVPEDGLEWYECEEIAQVSAYTWVTRGKSRRKMRHDSKRALFLARLITAAPDMLIALETIQQERPRAGQNEKTDAAFIKVAAAITKATQEEPND